MEKNKSIFSAFDFQRMGIVSPIFVDNSGRKNITAIYSALYALRNC
jgi:hypothetical protein